MQGLKNNVYIHSTLFDVHGLFCMSVVDPGRAISFIVTACYATFSDDAHLCHFCGCLALSRTRHLQGDSDCRQCMYVTTIEQEDEWKQCFEGYNVDVNDPCSPSTAMTCCLVASGENCMENEKFVEYSLCFIKESSGGAECPDSLTCDDSGAQLAATQENNAAGRLASPLHRAGSFVVGVTLALVGAANVVQ